MKKLTLIAFLFFSIFSFAQINFEKGYIITENGGKRELFIKNYAWSNNPIQIETKESETSPSVKIQISELKEFEVGSSYKYRKFTLPIDRSSDITHYMSSTRAPEYKTETLLLKVLIEGKFTLYSYVEGNLIRYFVEGDGKIDQLVYKPYLNKKGNVEKNQQYKQQLTLLLASNNLQTKDFEQLEYKEKSLIKLFEKYYGSNTNNFSNLKKNQLKGKFNLGVTAGINLISADIGIVNLAGSNTDFEKKISLNIGVEAEYILPFNKNKWSIFLNPNYQSYSSKVEREFGRHGIKAEIDYNNINFPIGVRYYMFLNDDSKLFTNLGYNMILNQKEVLKFEEALSSDLGVATAPSIFFGFGYAYNKFSFEGRVYTGRSLIKESIGWKSNMNVISFTAGYRIF